MIESGNDDELEKDRTLKQNRCLHSYCNQLAEAFNDAGMDMKATLKHDIEIPWSGERVKEFIFNAVSLAKYDKTSSELTTKEIQVVYEIVNRHTAEKFGIGLSWPDRFNGGKCE